MFRSWTVDRPQCRRAVWFRRPQQVSRKDGAARALAACLAAAALAAPSALADDLRSPDARSAAATHAQKRAGAFTGGARAPEWLWPDPAHATAPAPTTRARTPDATTAVEIAPDRGFDWTSAAIGAGGAIALAVISLIAAATLIGRSRAASHRTAPH
jgi:hypothetical protein